MGVQFILIGSFSHDCATLDIGKLGIKINDAPKVVHEDSWMCLNSFGTVIRSFGHPLGTHLLACGKKTKDSELKFGN